MLTLYEHPGTNVIEFTVDDGVTKEAFDMVAAKIDSVIQTHGKVRLIEVVHKIGSLEPAAIWADLKFSPNHLKYFSHVAVVADQKWIEWMTIIGKPFLSAQVRVFPLAQIDEARQWILQAPQTPTS